MDFFDEKTREEMIKELISHGYYDPDELDDMDDEEVKETYEDFLEELNDTSDMFPNGRDYDAEDEDGI